MGGSGARHRGSLGGDARRSGRGERGIRFGCGVRRFLLIGLERIDSTGSDAPKPRAKPAVDTAKPTAKKPKTTKDKKVAKDPETTQDAKDATSDTTTGPETSPSDSEQPEPTGPTPRDKGHRPPKRSTSAMGTPQKKPPAVDVEATTSSSAPPAASTTSAVTEQAPEPLAKPAAAQSPSTNLAAPASLVRATPTAVVAAAMEPPSVLGVIEGVISAVVVNVGSLVVNAVQTIEALVTGPPVVPPGSTVTVRSSTVQLSNGQRVAANWFYPETADGDPPANMILLQHGFFALGPMYSYTAANLAEKTNSVVVTTTLSSNPFAGDSFWLGGTGMSAAIADLFVGDRAALTSSAVDAGYAAKYGLDPAEARLPQTFALAGHSLGANLVSGAAGFLVAKGAADDLVGVILLDGVPVGTTLPDALVKLDAYAASAGGHYIPVREIGAPFNLYNSSSTVRRRSARRRDADSSTASCSMAVSTRTRCAAATPSSSSRCTSLRDSPSHRTHQQSTSCPSRGSMSGSTAEPTSATAWRQGPFSDLHAERYGARRRDRRSADGDAASRARGLRAVVTNDHSLGEPETGHPGRLSLTSLGNPWSTF